MSIKVDPRTGVIVRGPARLSKFPITPHALRLKKTNNMFMARSLPKGEAEESAHIAVSPHITKDQLIEIAREIGNTIASRIQSFQGTSSITSTKALESSRVKIDESIIDVGLENQKPLEKGTGSAKIAKDAIVEDNIADLKKSLKAIKSS